LTQTRFQLSILHQKTTDQPFTLLEELPNIIVGNDPYEYGGASTPRDSNHTAQIWHAYGKLILAVFHPKCHVRNWVQQKHQPSTLVGNVNSTTQNLPIQHMHLDAKKNIVG
jgi:hypothetical protein